ncbi:MAG TPA: ATP-binding protein [Gemmatimonadaceae bacterium]|nr:ATP-binding protein [Gemmatimonadaceae bacterium]
MGSNTNLAAAATGPALAPAQVDHPVFPGHGEMAARCRAFDWSKTPLGPVETWPVSLRTIVSTVLASRNPMFLWWGPELIQIYNDAYRPSFGQSGRDPTALGARGRDCWTDIWETIGPQIEGVMTRGESVWFEDAYIPIERNGRLEDVWWTYSYSAVRDDDGRIAGTLVVCQETTGRVLAEAALRRANQELEVERSRLAETFRQAPSFFAILRAPDLRFEFANEAYYGLIGRRDIIGKTLTEALPEVASQGFGALLHRVIETGEPVGGRETLVRLSRGPSGSEDRYVDFVYAPVTEADGSRSGAFVHGYDVTDHVLARRAVEQAAADRIRDAEERERLLSAAESARKEAESANRAKSEFLAVMSHELRTPLNAIDGYAELMEMEVHGPLTEHQRQDLLRIRKSQRHLLGLINGVLNYTRVEAGVAHYELRAIPLVEVLSSCDALMRPQMEHRELEFSVELCSPDLKVIADSEKLQQIVLNLLTNASKFTQPGGHVRLSCAVRPLNVGITVADTGRGIPKEQIERIFEPFVQVDARLTRTEEGVGLGLAISRDLAHGMNGEISLVSEVGKGSAFTVTIPRA